MGMLCTSFTILPCCLVSHYWLTVFLLALFCTLTPVRAVEINAVSFQLPPPPFLSGSLATNNVLTDAERLHEGSLSAPGSFVVLGDDIFTVTKDGLVVNIAPCRPAVVATLSPRGCRTPKECGSLISIKLNAENMLIVLDAYRGLFEVNPKTGLFRHVYNSNTVVNGRASVYLNDMAFLPGGTIVISDSSPTFDLANEFWIRFEGRPDGRLLGYYTASGQAKELFSGLAYPTGLEVTVDGKELLVAEAGRARILRLEVAKEKLNLRSTFNFNLPGMPEHIRRTKQGTYWVGLTYPRYQGEVSIMDQYSNAAPSRNFLARRRHVDQLILMYTRKGLAVELDGNGNVVSSIHDADGLRVKDVCEVVETDGMIYVGTRDQNAVLRVVKLAKDLTVTSSLQALRSRCQLFDDQLGVGRAALEQQLLARKSTPEYSHILASILSANSFNIVLQNYLHQQQSAALQASSQASARAPSQTANSQPRNRLDSIRQGLSQLQNALQNKRPAMFAQGKNSAAQPQNPMTNPTQANVPQNFINEDPFLPPGVSPAHLISPLRNIPQSDTFVPRRNSVTDQQHSPSSPLIVHRMENGQMVTHVLVGNDFKINDQTNAQQTSPKPAVANRGMTLQTFLPTPTPRARISEFDVGQNAFNRPQQAQTHQLAITNQHAPPTKLQEPQSAIGGFFDLLNGVQGIAKVKEINPLEETTPSVPLPDHAPIIQAENLYFLGPSHSEAHNYTPAEFSVIALSHNLSITQSKKINIDANQVFHPAQGAETIQQNTQSPINLAKSSFLRQGFQMLQQYLEQSKTAQPLVLSESEASQRNRSNSLETAVVFLNNKTVADQSLGQTNQISILPGSANQEMLPTVTSAEKTKDITTANGMLKDAQQLSYSRAAAIHPMQPINDVSAGEISSLVNNLPPNVPTQMPQAVTVTENEGGSLTSYIKIVQGPGKYILIPLTHTTLLQALRGVASNEKPGNGAGIASVESRQQVTTNVQTQDGPVGQLVSNQESPGSQSRHDTVDPSQMSPTNIENSRPAQSWPTNNQNNPQTQPWPTNNRNNPSTQSWPTNNQNNPPTQTWSTNNQNNPPTQSWSTNNQNNPPTQSWSTNNENNPPTQSWSTSNQNNPPTQSWSTNNQNNSPTHSWSTNNQPTQPNAVPTQSAPAVIPGAINTSVSQSAVIYESSPASPSSPQLTWPVNAPQDPNTTASSNVSTTAAQEGQPQAQAYVTQWQVPAS